MPARFSVKWFLSDGQPNSLASLNVSSRFSSILGPFVFSTVILLTGSARYGILSLVLFFAVGILLLMRVNLEKGVREATPASA